VAALVLAVCALLFYRTTTFDTVPPMLSQNIPPSFFPQIVLILIMAMTAVLPFEHALRANRGRNIDKGRAEPVRPVTWLTMAAVIAIAVAMPWLGTFLTMVAVCFVVPPLWGERRLRYIVPFAVLFPLAVGLLFQRVLGVFFEPGIFDISLR
jgi:putative tricarboxylic transport membrane protein